MDTLQKTATPSENEALIQEMLRDAHKVELPDPFLNNPIIHAGDGDVPAPMVVKQVSSAGYVYIWDTRTFDRVPVLYYMLSSKLRQRRPDGSYRFTTVDPKQKPVRGTLKCYLHPTGPDRERFNTLGFPVCQKNNITNQYQLEQHMAKKHPQEAAAIKAEKVERERQEDRELQRALLRAQTANIGAYSAATPPPPAPSLTCDICGVDFGTRGIMEKHRLTHK